jgi:hypothetical protein
MRINPQKVRALKMMTAKERRKGIPWYDSAAWQAHKAAISRKVEGRLKFSAAERRAKRKKNWLKTRKHHVKKSYAK